MYRTVVVITVKVNKVNDDNNQDNNNYEYVEEN